MSWVRWGVVWLLVACGAGDRAGGATGSGAQLSSVKPAPVPTPTPPPLAATQRAPALRWVERSGSQAEDIVDGVGRSLSTGGDGKLVLDLPNGSRVHIDPDSRAYLLELAPSSVLLLSGSAFVELPPQGRPAGQVSLRVISSQGTLVAPNMVELLIAERPFLDAHRRPQLLTQSYLAIVRGSGELTWFGDDGTVRTETMLSGQVASSGPKLAPPVALTLDAARHAAGALLRQAAHALRMPDVDARLVRALAAVVDEGQQGKALLARLSPPAGDHLAHQNVLPGAARGARLQTQLPDPSAGLRPRVSDVREYQRALASHAQRKLATRQALLLAAEQSLFGTLAACAIHKFQDASCEDLAKWRTQFLGPLRDSLDTGIRPN